MSAIRAGDIKGIHRVDAISHLERLEITHTAHDRSLFASGAVELANDLVAARGRGALKTGIHDPFSMLPETVSTVEAHTPQPSSVPPVTPESATASFNMPLTSKASPFC